MDSLDRLTKSCFWTLKLFFKLLQAVFGQEINVMEIRANCNKALYLSVRKCNPSVQEQVLRANLERIKGDMIMKKKGFTLVELLVVIAIIALLMGILMPALARVRQIANRMVCGSNLSGIGKAILIYANDYEDEFPNAELFSNKIKWANNGQSKDYDAVERSLAYSKSFSTITSSLFLLVKYADVTCKQFICKGDIGVEEFKLDQDPACQADEITQCWDFGLNPGQHESYSYHNPYKQSSEAEAYFPLNTQSSPSSPLCADRNPFLTVSLQTSNEVEPPEWINSEYYDPDNLANSGSHQRDGQNVLYVDMHVKFEKKTNLGIENDNIWGWWSDNTTSSSITPEDRETGMEFPPTPNGNGAGGSDAAGLLEKDAYLVHEMDKEGTP